MTYWERVCSYRFDPFFTGTDGRPFPPSLLPWLFPVSRVWLAAFWFAWWDPPTD